MYPSKREMDVLYRIIPLDPVGLFAVVPDGTFMAPVDVQFAF